jgi:[acyl-carrier-protein] S-malonyltransferase
VSGTDRKKRLVVVCPGRGSYTKENLRSLPEHRPRFHQFIDNVDRWRNERGEPTITELDEADTFKVSVHTKGEHASPLIYTCAALDFQSINREKFEIVAICGNSMGWYLTLAFAGALDERHSFELIQTMGSMMKAGLVGGQIIYPVVKDNWQKDPELEARALTLAERVGAEVSIRLGGYIVFGGTPDALKVLMQELPKSGDYPFQLINHGAFHTSLMNEISARAQAEIPLDWFHAPKIPMIDGAGRIWQPWSTEPADLRAYTLVEQVIRPYDFSRSVAVAVKEYAPDHLVLLGPGGSLGGSLGQILVGLQWQGIVDKDSFQERQRLDPFLLSMGQSGAQRAESTNDQRQRLL